MTGPCLPFLPASEWTGNSKCRSLGWSGSSSSSWYGHRCISSSLWTRLLNQELFTSKPPRSSAELTELVQICTKPYLARSRCSIKLYSYWWAQAPRTSVSSPSSVTDGTGPSLCQAIVISFFKQGWQHHWVLLLLLLLFVGWLILFWDTLSLCNSFHNITVIPTASPAKTIYFRSGKQIFSTVLLCFGHSAGSKKEIEKWVWDKCPRSSNQGCCINSCLQQTIRDHIKNGPGAVDI